PKNPAESPENRQRGVSTAEPAVSSGAAPFVFRIGHTQPSPERRCLKWRPTGEGLRVRQECQEPEKRQGGDGVRNISCRQCEVARRTRRPITARKVTVVRVSENSQQHADKFPDLL